MSIEVSFKAKEMILNGLKERQLDIDKAGFRFGVKGGGCSGFQYYCSFAKEKNKDDQKISFEINGIFINIFIDSKSYFFAKNTFIDYKKSLMNSGFQFINRDSIGSCGCGESFSV